MSGTTKEEISAWFDTGKNAGDAYMIIMCDIFDWSDYPIYCKDRDKAQKELDYPEPMHKIMEVYDLSQSKADQLAERRAWRI